MAEEKILLSACLAGVNRVYDGTNKFHPVFVGMSVEGKAVLFCPEVLGGMKIPHPPSEIQGGDGFDVLSGAARVVSREGKDVTLPFLKGAHAALACADRRRIRRAILKSKSPSCGCGWIFDGAFSKKLIRGYGVTTVLLTQSGIAVISDVQYLRKLPQGPQVRNRIKSVKRSVGDRKQ